MLIEGANASGNLITQNSIDANGGLGIHLKSGANNNQAAPVLDLALISGNHTEITGTLHGTPNTAFTIEFFSENACDPVGSGEGLDFAGDASVTTDGNGDAAIDSPVLIFDNFVTATATDPQKNTSEFSNCIPLIFTTIEGNANCDGAVHADDATTILAIVAGVQSVCGQPVSATGVAHDPNDVNCDGHVTSVDALDVLLSLANLPELPTASGCPAVGDPLTR